MNDRSVTVNKFCRGCQTEKSVADFAINRSRKDGLHSRCKLCANAAHRAYYQRPENRGRKMRYKYSQPISKTIAERLEAGIDRDQVGAGCWEWQKAANKEGYGVIYTGGPLAQDHTHRVAWQLAGNPMPVFPMVVDHRCYNRACCNPAHLRVVRQGENCTTLARDNPPKWWEWNPEKARRKYLRRKARERGVVLPE